MADLSDDLIARFDDAQSGLRASSGLVPFVDGRSLPESGSLAAGYLHILWSFDQGRIDAAAAAAESGGDVPAAISQELDDFDLGDDDDVIDAIPAFGRLSYRGEFFAYPLSFAPSDSAVTSYSLPWSGKLLSPDAFTFEAWSRDDRQPAFVIIGIPPVVDEKLRGIIENLPEDFQPSEARVVPAVIAVTAAAVASHYVDKALNIVDRRAVNFFKADNHANIGNYWAAPVAVDQDAMRYYARNGGPRAAGGGGGAALTGDESVDELIAKRNGRWRRP